MRNVGRKLRVGVLFGGCSGEHEVSLDSARSILAYLDRDKYEVIPIGITRAGQWLIDITPAQLEQHEQETLLPLDHLMVTDNGITSFRQFHPLCSNAIIASLEDRIDVIFPALHGTYGEDGAIQGFLEMLHIPYVGCGILGSALGMDKDKSKMVFRAINLYTAKHRSYYRQAWKNLPDEILDNVTYQIGYPCFVKPANGGSSIGVSKAYTRRELYQAINLACEYDGKVIVEQAINCRELSCAVLGNHHPVASLVGEVIVQHDFYDYEAKYHDGTSYTIIPTDISPSLIEAIREQAIRVFVALDLCGLARIDFFLEKGTQRIYVNEVNTLPSFTDRCMYAKLCTASGLSYPHLLDHLIALAQERYDDRLCNRLTVPRTPSAPLVF